MNRAELKTIAEGFKKARPRPPAAVGAETQAYIAWEITVRCVALSLKLEGKPLSNFEAACGFIHSDQG